MKNKMFKQKKQKVRVVTSEKDVRRASRSECEEYREEIFKECADDIMAQALCTVFYTLLTAYGWRKQRLRNFADALHATNDLMCNPSRLHHRFSPLDIEQTLKDKYSLDLRREFKANIEIKP